MISRIVQLGLLRRFLFPQATLAMLIFAMFITVGTAFSPFAANFRMPFLRTGGGGGSDAGRWIQLAGGDGAATSTPGNNQEHGARMSSSSSNSPCVNSRGCNGASGGLLGFCACAALTRMCVNPITQVNAHNPLTPNPNGSILYRKVNNQLVDQSLDTSRTLLDDASNGRSVTRRNANGRSITRSSDANGNQETVEAEKALSLSSEQSIIDNVPTASIDNVVPTALTTSSLSGSVKASHEGSATALSYYSYPSWWPYQSHQAHTMIRPPMPGDPDYVLPVPLAFDNACYISKKYSEQGFQIAKSKMNTILGKDTFFLVEGWSESFPTDTSSGEKPKDLLGPKERHLLSKLDLPGFQTRCEQFVGASTDATWASKATDRASIKEIVYRHFHEEYEARSFGLQYTVTKGLDNLTDMVYNKRKMIPDLRIRILSTFCTPYALDKNTGEVLAFFTTMPDMSRGHFDGEVTFTFPDEDNNQEGHITMGVSSEDSFKSYDEGRILADEDRSSSEVGNMRSVTYKGNHQPVTYMGNAVTLVVKDRKDDRWKYLFETVGHDDATMYTQMGLGQEFMKTQNAKNSLAALGDDHCGLDIGMPVF